jgi:hypothetical protein
MHSENVGVTSSTLRVGQVAATPSLLARTRDYAIKQYSYERGTQHHLRTPSRLHLVVVMAVAGVIVLLGRLSTTAVSVVRNFRYPH